MSDNQILEMKLQVKKNEEHISELKSISDKIADAKVSLARRCGIVVYSN